MNVLADEYARRVAIQRAIVDTMNDRPPFTASPCIRLGRILAEADALPMAPEGSQSETAILYRLAAECQAWLEAKATEAAK